MSHFMMPILFFNFAFPTYACAEKIALIRQWAQTQKMDPKLEKKLAGLLTDAHVHGDMLLLPGRPLQQGEPQQPLWCTLRKVPPCHLGSPVLMSHNHHCPWVTLQLPVAVTVQ
jgi:hypothetical protein